MKKGEVLSATARAERSRAVTKAATARELLYAGVLARVWPSFVDDGIPNPEFPSLLCVDTPLGRLTWRLSVEEREFFEWIPRGQSGLKHAGDRTPLLHVLAENGWE